MRNLHFVSQQVMNTSPNPQTCVNFMAMKKFVWKVSGMDFYSIYHEECSATLEGTGSTLPSTKNNKPHNILGRVLVSFGTT